MKSKILVIFVVCLGLLALMPNEIENGKATSTIELVISDGVIYDAQITGDTEEGTNNDTNYGDEPVIGLASLSWTIPYSGLFWFKDNYISNSSTILEVTFSLYAYSEVISGPLDMNLTVYPLYSGFNESQATWNNRSDGQLWKFEGGHYDKSYLIDEITFLEENAVGWHEFNITTIYKDWVNNATQNYGIIIVCEDPEFKGVNFRSSEWTTASQRPKLNITYSGGVTGGQSTNLYEDVWNLKGFAGASNKLASTIYSEITNITAISWKNATTGYWYTYWPSLGLTEDEYLNFGDGLFILTDQDTTWDHT